MSDRSDPKPDRSPGPDAVEHPDTDVRSGARARPVPAPRNGDAQATPRRDVGAEEVISGNPRASTMATPERGQAHTADHSVTPPSGSNHAAVETPRSGRSTKLLIGAVVAVIVVIALMILIPAATEAGTILPIPSGDA
jgi:hypothetical protein